MKLRVAISLLLFSIIQPVSELSAGTPGTFRGTVIEAPQGESGEFVYLLGRNGQARRFNLSHSEVTYSDGVPKADRHENACMSVLPGSELRVTALQDDEGEWQAIRVEVLRVSDPDKRSK